MTCATHASKDELARLLGTRLEFYARIGPEPSMSDYGDLRRWDKWFAWANRWDAYHPCAECRVTPHGRVRSLPVLRSQVTRRFKNASQHRVSL